MQKVLFWCIFLLFFSGGWGKKKKKVLIRCPGSVSSQASDPFWFGEGLYIYQISPWHFQES